jgi:CBS domain containing-hemolysin-like protein
LVYEDSLDHLLGYVHASDLFAAPTHIRSILHPLIAVPMTMTADLLLREFTQQRKSVAVVVDEYGGTAGLVTVEDLVEVVFGDIEDEYDEGEFAENEHEWAMEPLGENAWRVGARVPVEEVNEQLELDLPLDEGYSTVGGLVMHVAERIPTVGEEVPTGHYTFTVERATRRRLETLQVRRLAPPDRGPHPDD